jgi:general secretion pathway protein D
MKKWAFLLILTIVLTGCTMFNRSYKLGTESAIAKDWDKAVEYFEQASIENPKNSVYRLALLRAKISAAYDHLQKARRLRSQGKKEESLAEYEKALFYDPENTAIIQEIKRYTEETPEMAAEKGGKKPIEPPLKLDLKTEKVQLSFKQEVSLRSIFTALGKHAGINVIFDNQFRDKPYAVELDNMSFEQAINILCMAAGAFYRVIDNKTILILQDNPQNRLKYEVNAVKTFYLSNINASEIVSALVPILRSPMRAPTISADKNMNSLTIRDSPEVVELAERIIRLWDKPQGEVVLDLELMEVSRIKLREFGLGLDNYGGSLQYKVPEDNNSSPDTSTTSDIGWINLSELGLNKKNFQVTFPSAFLKFLESDADTKFIAQPRLRGVGGQDIEYMVGDRIPIPRTTFSPFAGGGVATQPITNYEFENVGIEIKIKPTVHFEEEVSIELDVKIMAVGGTGYADIPIISTRQIKNVIRLKDGETHLLAGLLKDEERKTKKGFAWLNNIPILGDLFSNTDQQVTQTDVIMTITPHIIRMIPLTDKDDEALWVNLQTEVSGSSESTGTRAVQEDPFNLLQRERDEAMRELREEQQDQSDRLNLVPGNFEGGVGRNFRISVNLRTSQQIRNMSFTINFNSQILKLDQVIAGNYVQQFGGDPSFMQNIDNASGSCNIGFTSPDISHGFKGSGRVATLVFECIAEGEGTISISGVSANSDTGGLVNFETNDAQVRIRQ